MYVFSGFESVALIFRQCDWESIHSCPWEWDSPCRHIPAFIREAMSGARDLSIRRKKTRKERERERWMDGWGQVTLCRPFSQGTRNRRSMDCCNIHRSMDNNSRGSSIHKTTVDNKQHDERRFSFQEWHLRLISRDSPRAEALTWNTVSWTF